jgi:hypothetical protein
MAGKKASHIAKRCPTCGSECSADSDFCPSCGAMFESAGQVACTRHPARPAIAVCVLCQETVCKDCAVSEHGRTLCKTHSLVKIEQDYALVYSSSDINDAELARAVLDSRGFDVVVRDFTPIGYVWDGAGDSPFSRSMLRKLAKVFVPIPDYMRAVVVLNEWSTGKEFQPEE